MSTSTREVAATAVGVVGNLFLWRVASRAVVGFGLPGTVVAVAGLTLASVCSPGERSVHCMAGRAINLPGNFIGNQTMNALDKGAQMLNKPMPGQANFGRLSGRQRRLL